MTSQIIIKSLVLVFFTSLLTAGRLLGQTLEDFSTFLDGTKMKLELTIKFPDAIGLDDERFNYDQTVNLFAESKNFILNRGNLTVSRSGIVLSFDRSTNLHIVAQDINEPVYLDFPNGLKIATVNSSTRQTVEYNFTSTEIKDFTLGKGVRVIEIIKESNYAYTSIKEVNNINVGYAVENDGTKNSDYALSFNYTSNYNSSLPFYFEASGLISTNSKDSLNNLKIYPISFKYNKEVIWEIIGQIGSESNQNFSHGRIAGQIFYQRIIPNLINLSSGYSRFRLKPVLKIGILGYQEYAVDSDILVNSGRVDKKHFSFQPFAQLYYHIPVFESYSIILDLNSFYDTNNEVNLKRQFKFLYSFSFGSDIPKTHFKAVLKYNNGINNITFTQGRQIVIGLILDAIPN